MAVRIVLADDSYLVREGTAALLSVLPEVDLLASAGDLGGLLDAVRRLRPDVVMTDIRMPPGQAVEGLTAARRIRADYPGTGVILLTQFAEPEYAYELLRGGAAGVGYLLKDHIADIDELSRAISQVAAGGTALDPQLVEALADQAAPDEAPVPAAAAPAFVAADPSAGSDPAPATLAAASGGSDAA